MLAFSTKQGKQANAEGGRQGGAWPEISEVEQEFFRNLDRNYYLSKIISQGGEAFLAEENRKAHAEGLRAGTKAMEQQYVDLLHKMESAAEFMTGMDNELSQVKLEIKAANENHYANEVLALDVQRTLGAELKQSNGQLHEYRQREVVWQQQSRAHDTLVRQELGNRTKFLSLQAHSHQQRQENEQQRQENEQQRQKIEELHRRLAQYEHASEQASAAPTVAEATSTGISHSPAESKPAAEGNQQLDTVVVDLAAVQLEDDQPLVEVSTPYEEPPTPASVLKARQQLRERRQASAQLGGKGTIRRKLQIADRKPQAAQDESQSLQGRVRLVRKVELAPKAETRVQVKLEGVVGDSKRTYLFHPTSGATDRSWASTRGVLCPSAAGGPDDVLFLLNPTDEPITVYSWTVLGQYELLSEATVNAITVLPAPTTNVVPVSSAVVANDATTQAERDGLPTDEELRACAEKNNEHLTVEQKEQLYQLLDRFRYMFRSKPGRTDVTKHEIDTGDSKPVRGGRYRMSDSERNQTRKMVKELVEAGAVRPSNSPWAASVVLVPKKDGTTRFCVDYRRLNAVTIKDVYPLPRIDETLDKLGGNRYFTAMDLTAGFWQVELSEDAALKTAFVTPDGLYQWDVMPMGLANSPATFQRLMNQVLGPLRFEYALVYLDDVLVYSATFDEHLTRLEAVLTCIQKASLSIKLKKCFFAQAKTAYLGHIISGEGIEPDPKKLSAVKELVPPTNVKEIRMFLGFVGYYRRFIPNFSAVAKPLNQLLRKTQEWVWKEEQQAAFEQLRDKLLEAPVLAMPDYTRPFFIRTDASYNGLGASLVQEDKDTGARRPVAYSSRSLKAAECNYTATEIEVLGMKWAVQQYRPYVHGVHFTLETDHVALRWLQTVQHNNARLIRTALELQQHDFTVVHKPGLTMHDADALSRLPRQTAAKKEATLSSKTSTPAREESGTYAMMVQRGVTTTASPPAFPTAVEPARPPADGGLIQLCRVCDQPKRNHTCPGKYTGVRQLAVNRARLGYAAADAPPLFAIVKLNDEGRPKQVHTVHAQYDRRKVEATDRLIPWVEECTNLKEWDNSMSPYDLWNSSCEFCGQGGVMELCYGCNVVAHPQCHSMQVLGRKLEFDEEYLCVGCTDDLLQGTTTDVQVE